MAEIQLKNLSKRWGSFVGVDNFDLTVADKEFLVLLGPSGCGKTTTMRMIAGLEDATEGEILIDGKVVNDLQPESFCKRIQITLDSAARFRQESFAIVCKKVTHGLSGRKTTC